MIWIWDEVDNRVAITKGEQTTLTISRHANVSPLQLRIGHGFQSFQILYNYVEHSYLLLCLDKQKCFDVFC